MTWHQIQFAHPWALVLLLLLPLLAILRGRRGKAAAIQYSGLSLFGPLVRGRKVQPGGWLSALRYLALFCFLVALARPQKVNSSTQVQESGIDMMLAIDLSPSMEALDYHKDGQDLSRVEVVRETVGSFIQARPNDRIGMVAFAGDAYLMSPLTLDHDWLLQNVDRLQVGLAGDATAIGSALAACANRLRDQPAKSKIIVLLTDGANNAGKITPLAAAEAAHALGIKIYTIGAGSDDVAKFPIRDEWGHVTYTTIPVDIDNAALQKIADIGGGKFFRAADYDTLKHVYAEINKLETSEVAVKHFQHVKEYFVWALYPGLLFLGLEIALAHTPLEEGAVISELWDRLDPGFLAPVWLLVGLAAVLTVLLLEIGAARRRKQAMRLFAASHLIAALTGSISPFKRLLKRVLLVCSVALLFTAMARPHLLFDWREENRTGLDILMAVDCSKSMLTDDVKPSRLERAKLALADFADRLPDNRLGLIAFAGDAFLQCPLTLDHDAFQTAVRELDTDTIPRPGTDIATAIEQAVEALGSQPNNMKILVLVTDGEDLEGRVLDAAKAAKQAGLTIYTVGVGTPEGGLIPERDDTGALVYHHDASGQIVQSKLDENTLRQIASLTGGAYVPLGQRGEGLEEIYDRYIAPLPKQNFEERREKIHIERFEWPLAAAILFLMWEFLTGERAEAADPPATGPSRRPVRRGNGKSALAATPLIALGLLLAGPSGPLRAAATDTAERDYKSGKYEDALENYRQAAEVQPKRNDLQYNRGDAAYKTGEFNEAEEAFHKALDTPDLGLQENAYYNLGNTQFRHGEALQKVDTEKTMGLWEQALHSYDSALKLKNTADARHNYEIVKEKLEQLKKQQQQQQQQQKQDKDNQSPSDKQDQSKPGQGKDQQNQSGQNQQGQNNSNSQNDQNSPQGQQPQSGDKTGQDKQADSAGQNGRQASAAKDMGQQPVRAYSGSRSQDQNDPGVKSRQEAEDLLDSLKDDERHVTARTLNGNNENPPPPSGKDW